MSECKNTNLGVCPKSTAYATVVQLQSCWLAASYHRQTSLVITKLLLPNCLSFVQLLC